ncbi:hypothetical protein CYY_000173 [Polysphondylium violaceum]|uniref:SMP-30/Gluconolactonase/LRE-like region domain-containing protein n=1 Tax=Polysphondylium violaceum TaxID=133409 RepID=A0A8J4Q5A0_9MYCE|nr:hypothetical protein CYY_000173 [Polysphondylium violaceum]
MFLPFQPDLPFFSFEPKPIGDEYYNSREMDDTMIEYIPLGDYQGPESLTISKKNGNIYFPLKSGEIKYIEPPFPIYNRVDFFGNSTHSSKVDIKTMNQNVKHLVTCGRALGVEMDADDNLIIADSVKGLLKYDFERQELIILTSTFNGTKLSFVNDLTIAKDGMIYFSDTSNIAPIRESNGDWNTLTPSLFICASSSGFGKLLSYNPKTRETNLLMTGIRYSNGVCLDPKEESIFVAETGAYRILRYWLKGPNAGKHEVFIDNLPGNPDGIDLDSKGRLVISIYATRSKFLDTIHPYPWLKRIFLRIPYIKVPMSPPALVISDTKNGRILEYYTISSRSLPMKSISSTLDNKGKIYLGNLYNNFISIFSPPTQKK